MIDTKNDGKNNDEDAEGNESSNAPFPMIPRLHMAKTSGDKENV